MPGMDKTLKEWKSGDLHSGSKHGPIVKSQKQAIAIGLSEERKKGHHVAKKHHSFESSNIPYGHATEGKPNEHHMVQGHKVSGHHAMKDGAGRHGHDESGHRSYSEHKEPHHPAGSHTKQGHDPVKDGAYGYPGETMRLDDGGDREHSLIASNYSQTAHEPARLKTPDGQGFTAGHPGIHAGMEAKPHGFGHQMSQKRGNMRLSGHPGAHRVGKR
jgi:hypothetical protein